VNERQWSDRLRSLIRSFRRRRIAVWASAFAALTAVELAIALPLLISDDGAASERSAPHTVLDRKIDAKVFPQAGVAAERGRDVLLKRSDVSALPSSGREAASYRAGPAELSPVSESSEVASSAAARHSEPEPVAAPSEDDAPAKAPVKSAPRRTPTPPMNAPTTTATTIALAPPPPPPAPTSTVPTTSPGGEDEDEVDEEEDEDEDEEEDWDRD
jgi:hypothetical protein